MKLNKYAFILLMLTLLLSCKEKENNESISNQNNSQTKEIQIENDSPSIDTTEIIKKLQGMWKEAEYPYRRAQFRNSTVKFVEEGVPENPAFKKFEISNECSYPVNNIRDISTNEIILKIPDDKRCEKIRISKASLVLSGYSTHRTIL